MTPELNVIVILLLTLVGGFILTAMSYRELQRTLRSRDEFIRQLLDRLATHEYGVKDPIIGRIHATMPQSVKEAQDQVAGPHGRAFNETEMPKDKTPSPRKGVKTKRYKLDMAEEFNL